MNVTQAKPSHAPSIAILLAGHYKEANDRLGASTYISDAAVLENHIQKRLQEPHSKFVYFVLLDESESVRGFINIFLDTNHNEVLVLVLEEEFMKEENIRLLLDDAISYIQENNSRPIHFELYNEEQLFSRVLEAQWALHYSTKWLLTK